MGSNQSKLNQASHPDANQIQDGYNGDSFVATPLEMDPIQAQILDGTGSPPTRPPVLIPTTQSPTDFLEDKSKPQAKRTMKDVKKMMMDWAEEEEAKKSHSHSNCTQNECRMGQPEIGKQAMRANKDGGQGKRTNDWHQHKHIRTNAVRHGTQKHANLWKAYPKVREMKNQAKVDIIQV